jgi:two-component system, OmpR family, aerobic respiration control sensor histidine kinase ArcB
MEANQPLIESNLVNEQVLSLIFDYFKVNFFAISKNGEYISKNDQLTALVGNTEKADKIDEKAWLSCQEVMLKKERQIVEEEYNGRWYLSVKTPMLKHKQDKNAGESDVIGVIGISLDITEKKQAELTKSEFLKNMSHDIRTPFCGIFGLSQHLFLTEDNLEKKKLLGCVAESSERLLNFLNDILAVSYAASYEVNYTEFNISDLVNNLASLMKSELELKQISLMIDCPSVNVRSDNFRLGKVLLNLLSNAIKFTQTGYIKISVKVANKIEMSIEDTGIGISEDNLDSIFDQFYKIKPNYKSSNYVGPGLGLYLAKQIALEIGGKISVVSTLGKGSKFTFTQLMQEAA